MKPELKFSDEKEMLYTSFEYAIEKETGIFSAKGVKVTS